MEKFTNSIVFPEDLPEIDKKTFNPLDKKYRNILFIYSGLTTLIASGGLTVPLLFSGTKASIAIPLIAITFISFLVISITMTILGFPKKGYLVREKDISYQKGLITYKLISVPFNRFQHVEVNQGILAKIFKLASVKIYTAGGNASDLSIPGLPVGVAHNLKSFLSEKIGEHE